jgi:hypothetical protein
MGARALPSAVSVLIAITTWSDVLTLTLG